MLEDASGTSRNPLDNISIDPAWAEQRAKDIKYMRFCALGLVCTIGATLVTVAMFPAPGPEKKSRNEQNKRKGSSFFTDTRMDTPEKGAEEFQGKPVVVIAGGQRVVARDEITGDQVELVNTGTSTIPHFPKTIKIPSSATTGGPAEENEYTLLGLGIRTVSLFSIQVYVVGMYVQTSSLSALQARMVKEINPTGSALIAGEKDELRSVLLDAEKSYALWDRLLSDPDSGLKTAFRVVPVKNTDFGHLRDGWVRAITSRTQSASKTGDSQFSDDSFGLAMRNFKDLMQGKGKAPTGSIILLTRDADGTLGVLYQGKDGKVEDFGSLKDERIARLVWLGYLGGKNVSSEPARRGIVEGVMELVERPIGSVETKVS
jgi:hypothetical protein